MDLPRSPIKAFLVRCLRRVGLRMHDFASTGHKGRVRVCRDCGEERQCYTLNVAGGAPSWWETTREGDGSCGVAPLKPRFEPDWSGVGQ